MNDCTIPYIPIALVLLALVILLIGIVNLCKLHKQARYIRNYAKRADGTYTIVDSRIPSSTIITLDTSLYAFRYFTRYKAWGYEYKQDQLEPMVITAPGYDKYITKLLKVYNGRYE